MIKRRNLQGLALGIALLMLAALACGPGGAAGDGTPSVTITSPASGSTATVGEELQIVSTAAADAGVERVELAVNGQVVRTDSPPSGNPTTFSIVQPWTPAAEGLVTLSVIVYDTEGQASEPATITLQVGGAVADVTPTPVEDVGGPGGCTLNASFVDDVTVDDNTEMAPGEAFVKTWRLRDSGSCDWGTGFTLAFVGGDQMGGPASVAVPATAAGSTADVSVNLVAPSAPGTYRGNWRMQSDEGLAFGSQVYVQIVVPEEPTEEPTEEATPEPPTDLDFTLRSDGSARFTWDDAVGEAEYRFEFSFISGGAGTTESSTLPANTTSWTSEVLDCDGHGGFTIIALADDSSEIGRLTVSFDTPDCESPETVILSPVDSRSGDMGTGGCSAGLPVRAGIAPAGAAIRGFATFEISDLHGATIVDASLDLSDYSLTGDPFEFLHPLRIERVEFSGGLCGNPGNFDAAAEATLAHISAASPGLTNPVDVTDGLADHLDSGDPEYFQVRLRWEGDDGGSAYASMIEWSTVEMIVVYQP
jgi:hypothetical protein